MARILERSHQAMGRPYVPEQVLDDAMAFVEALAPGLENESSLEAAYRQVMSSRDSDFPLSVTEINKAWREMGGGPRADPRPPCAGCEFQEEGGRPCRFHDQEAWEKWRTLQTDV